MKGIKCQTGKDDRGKFEKTIINVALNVLYEKETKICPEYISKYNSSRKKQITILMICHEKCWNYFAVTKLLRGTTSKSNGDFFRLNCFHSFGT